MQTIGEKIVTTAMNRFSEELNKSPEKMAVLNDFCDFIDSAQFKSIIEAQAFLNEMNVLVYEIRLKQDQVNPAFD